MWEATGTVNPNLDLSKVCRTCMKESEHLMFMFDSYGKYDNRPLNEMFTTCTQLEIHKEDGLPVKMCPRCSECVEEAYCFRLQAERCNTLLKDIVTNRAFNKTVADIEIKEEVVKDEINDYDGGGIDTTYFSDDSDDAQPLSSIKKPGVVLYSCKFCELSSTVEDDILTHLVTSHREECGLMGSRGRGRPSQQELADRKMRIQRLLDNYVNRSDYESKVVLKLEMDSNRDTQDDSNNITTSNYLESTDESSKESTDDQDTDSDCSSETSESISDDNENTACEDNYTLCVIPDIPDMTKGDHTSSVGVDVPDTISETPNEVNNSESIKKIKKIGKVKRNTNYICDMCGKSFCKEGHLARHKGKCRMQSGREEQKGVEKVRKADKKKEKTFLCTACSKAFYREEQLTRHQRTHLPREKKYHCPECPKKYDRPDKLKFHSRVHVVNKSELESNFLCVYCGHGFSNSSNLIVHLRRHTGEKPYKCDLCQKGFPRSTDLQNHRIIHTGERPCVCKICGKAFSHQHKLVRHERIHTGHKPFKCTLCERAFTQSNDLTLHIRRHTGDRPYVCTVCGDRFYLNTVLQAHKRTHGHYDAKEQEAQARQDGPLT